MSVKTLCYDAVPQSSACASLKDVATRSRFPEVSGSATVTWEDLEDADPLLAKLAKAMASRYGYTVPGYGPGYIVPN